MKKLISILLILISVNAISQTKEDSLLIIEANAYVDSIAKKIPLIELREWTYKNTSAERYDLFMGLYNAFLQEKGLIYFNSRKKKPK